MTMLFKRTRLRKDFEIGNVDIESLHSLHDDLEVGGDRGDYSERVGLTQNPISTLSISTFPILHALLRGLDYCLKIVYKLKGGVTAWKHNRTSRCCKEESPRLHQVKDWNGGRQA